ncbi:MAG: NAD(P)-binding domain-containing protein [Defluviitaleaceae bacterium]|nr:NAD(P)-binding domain-containing protein [Defluviitaleaceae bacterium]
MKIGILGVGTIATCVVTGFCGLDDRHDFFLSPRNVVKSAALAEKYGNCRVCLSNQEVLDNSDVIIISMNAASVAIALPTLTFRDDHVIINLVASIPPEDILTAVGAVKGFYHVVPLPFVEKRIGPIAAYPECGWLHNLLTPLGNIVFAKNMDEIRTMQAITALMSTFYETLNGLTLFAEAHGMDGKKAKDFAAAFFGALCVRAEEANSFRDLALDMTPGGLNEFCVRILEERGVTQAWAAILPEVLEKIKP